MLIQDVAPCNGPFTRCINLTLTPPAFEECIRFLHRRYELIGLDEVIEPSHDQHRRPLLVTFDDAYGSVAREAVPILERYGVPAVFFVNAASVEGDHLPIDNLICFVANTAGFGAVRAAAAQVGFPDSVSLASAPEVVARVVSILGSATLDQFASALRDGLTVDPRDAARRLGLFLTSELGALPAADVVVGMGSSTLRALVIYEQVLRNPPRPDIPDALRSAGRALMLELKNHDPRRKRERSAREHALFAEVRWGSWPLLGNRQSPNNSSRLSVR